MKFRENDYYQYINDIARDAAKERVKFMINDLKVNPADDDEDKIYRAYVKSLIKKYPYQDSDEFFNSFNTLKNTPSSTIASWLMGGNGYNDAYDPKKVKEKADLEKFLPLIAGIAEPKNDWLSTNGEALRDEAAKFGYSREEFPEFLEKLRKYQTDYDRAKLWEEYKKESGDFNYTLNNLLYPSAMQELQNAVLTGEGSEDTVEKLAYMDKAANLATAAMPSVRFVKSPLTNGFLQALSQGAAEAGRQGLKTGLSTTGQEFDMGPVVGGTVAGSTAPGMIGSARQILSQFQGKGARDFSRGLQKVTRYGDPVNLERLNLEDLLKRYNNFYVEQNQVLGELDNIYKKISPLIDQLLEKNPKLTAREITELVGPVNGIPKDKINDIVQLAMMQKDNFKILSAYPLDEVTDLGVNSKVEQILDYLGDGYTDTSRRVNIDKILGAYDKPRAALLMRENGRLTPAPTSVINNNREIAKRYGIDLPAYKRGTVDPNSQFMSKESMDLFQQLFPAKAAEAFSKKTRAYTAGEVLGNILQNAGGRVEPTIKVNPFGSQKFPETDYKEQSWYKKLKEKNPDAAKILEEALKNKQ